MSHRLSGHILAVVAILIIAFASGGVHKQTYGQALPDAAFILTILHNNDAESALIDRGDGLEDFGGVARFVTVLKREREAALQGGGPVKRGVVTVSSGDNSVPGPEFSASLAAGKFYDAIAMDLAGFDAIGLGNHDFDSGPDVLADFIEDFQLSKPPFVSANLDFSSEARLQALVETDRLAGSVVIEENGERIGVVGVTTPRLPFLSSPRNVRVSSNVADEVQAEVDALEAAGVNKIMLVSHLQGVDVDAELVAQVSGVDVVVGGGGGDLLANPGDRLIPGDEPTGPYPFWASDATGRAVPVVTTSGLYGYVGKIVVEFDAAGEVIKVDDASGPIRVAGGSQADAVQPDATVYDQVVAPVIAYVEGLAAKIVAVSEVDLDGRRSRTLTQETNEGNLIADAFLWQADRLAADFGVSTPQIALLNGGAIRNDSVIPPGPISELHTFSIVPFPNFITVVEDIPGDQFKEILENAVSCAASGDLATNPNCTDGRFAQIAGFSFVWDPTGTAQVIDANGAVTVVGDRIKEATLENGAVIVQDGEVLPGDGLTIATNDFAARGGDQYPFRNTAFTVLGVSSQQVLLNFLQDPDGLAGVISAGRYHAGGEGRITTLSASPTPSPTSTVSPTTRPSSQRPAAPPRTGAGEDGASNDAKAAVVAIAAASLLAGAAVLGWSLGRSNGGRA
jgi:5'-nucleotidase